MARGQDSWSALNRREVPPRPRRYWLAGVLIGVACATASAQTFYKWTDDQGVVHFSDEPPTQAKHVEERNLSGPPGSAAEAGTPAAAGEATPPAAPPAAGTPAAAEPAKAGASAAGDTSAGAPATEFTGPSRVVMVSRQTPRTGPGALHIFGQVRNVGAADAHNVSVTISAVDATQGTPCLQEDAVVVPSTLHAGEIGHFDVNIDSPCLYGEPPVDVVPVWQ